MTAYRIPRKRYLRNQKSDRVRHARYLDGFITDRQTDLDSTGAAKTFTLASDAYGITATGVLTATGQPSAGGTVTVGTQTYTWVSALTAPAVVDEVKIGADAETSLANLAAAINAGSGAGTKYGTGTTANEDATATSDATHVNLSATATLSASGNSVSTTENSANMSFGAATLTGGADPSHKITATTHGFSVGDGPFLLSTSDTLPGGLEAGVFYFVNTVVDANTIKLCTAFDSQVVTQITSAGAGTQTMTKASNYDAIFEYLKKNQPAVVAAATDVDDL